MYSEAQLNMLNSWASNVLPVVITTNAIKLTELLYCVQKKTPTHIFFHISMYDE